MNRDIGMFYTIDMMEDAMDRDLQENLSIVLYACVEVFVVLLKVY